MTDIKSKIPIKSNALKGVTGNVKFLGFIWDSYKTSMMYNYWVWAQSRRLNLVLLGGYVFGIVFFLIIK